MIGSDEPPLARASALAREASCEWNASAAGGEDQGSNVTSETWVPAPRPEFEDNRAGPDPSDRSLCDYISGLAH